jgi:hypothetical protein
MGVHYWLRVGIQCLALFFAICTTISGVDFLIVHVSASAYQAAHFCGRTPHITEYLACKSLVPVDAEYVEGKSRSFLLVTYEGTETEL